jgi:large subunit ribosomal protein L30
LLKYLGEGSNMSNKVKVTLVKSVSGRPARHQQTVRTLGLRRIGHSVEVADTATFRGMIASVSHLLKVEATA